MNYWRIINLKNHRSSTMFSPRNFLPIRHAVAMTTMCQPAVKHQTSITSMTTLMSLNQLAKISTSSNAQKSPSSNHKYVPILIWNYFAFTKEHLSHKLLFWNFLSNHILTWAVTLRFCLFVNEQTLNVINSKYETLQKTNLNCA